MAGDWIKMESTTPEKQEVLAIAAQLGIDDPDLVVGKLFRMWRWFDQQTVDGNARSVTSALLNRVVGVSGFAEAMAKVGWLEVYRENDQFGVRLPNFDRHCGKTAKSRAMTAQRVALHKSNASGNGEGNGEGNGGGNAASVSGTVSASVSEALPREEKRREEEKKNPPTPRKRGVSASGPDFDRFWAAYPKRESKPEAEKAWRQIRPGHALVEEILSAVDGWKRTRQWQDDDGRYIPQPATWLRKNKWQDIGAQSPTTINGNHGIPYWVAAGYGTKAEAEANGISPPVGAHA